jgi:hypothetical protein
VVGVDVGGFGVEGGLGVRGVTGGGIGLTDELVHLPMLMEMTLVPHSDVALWRTPPSLQNSE